MGPALGAIEGEKAIIKKMGQKWENIASLLWGDVVKFRWEEGDEKRGSQKAPSKERKNQVKGGKKKEIPNWWAQRKESVPRSDQKNGVRKNVDGKTVG